MKTPAEAFALAADLYRICWVNTATPTPISRATASNVALSGGSNLATALSLNSCPYLATSLSHQSPRIQDFIEATTILTRQ